MSVQTTPFPLESGELIARYDAVVRALHLSHSNVTTYMYQIFLWNGQYMFRNFSWRFRVEGIKWILSSWACMEYGMYVWVGNISRNACYYSMDGLLRWTVLSSGVGTLCPCSVEILGRHSVHTAQFTKASLIAGCLFSLPECLICVSRNALKACHYDWPHCNHSWPSSL